MKPNSATVCLCHRLAPAIADAHVISHIVKLTCLLMLSLSLMARCCLKVNRDRSATEERVFTLDHSHAGCR